MCFGAFPFTTCRSRLTIPAVSTNQNWKRVCVFLCQKTVMENYDRSRSFSFLFLQQFNSMLSINSSAFDTSSTPTPVDSMSYVPVSLCSLDSSDSLRLWEFLLPRVPHLLRFPISTSAPDSPQLVRCHHQPVLHLDSEFSLDSRMHCSAIPVSRLLTVLCKTMISIVHIVCLSISLLDSSGN